MVAAAGACVVCAKAMARFRSTSKAPHATRADHCPWQWQFESYQPSLLEQEWKWHAASWQKELCTHVGRHRDRIASWLDYVAQHGASNRQRPEPKSDVFSSLTFRRRSGDGARQESMVKYIEPLAAALRHPLTFCHANFTMSCTSKRECAAVTLF